MSTHESAANQDPTLFCAYFGGPRDGFMTGDLPVALSGNKLTGSVARIPMSQPSAFSLHAVYVCTSETQIDGFWEFRYIGMEGPNGEKLITEEGEQRNDMHDPRSPSAHPRAVSS